MPQTVWITRHGNRQDFVDPEWYKSAARPHDPGLSPDGIEQAQQVGGRLHQESIAYIFASPFLRTVQTAHHIAEAIDLPIYLEPGLGEWLNPEWFASAPERLAPGALAELFPRIDLNYTPRGTLVYPETKAEAFERAGATARHLAGAYDAPLLLVGHGASVTGAVQGLTGRRRDMECALCSLYKLVHRNRQQAWALELEGDVAHLDHRIGADRFN